jgi:hypothetical protein
MSEAASRICCTNGLASESAPVGGPQAAFLQQTAVPQSPGGWRIGLGCRRRAGQRGQQAGGWRQEVWGMGIGTVSIAVHLGDQRSIRARRGSMPGCPHPGLQHHVQGPAARKGRRRLPCRPGHAGRSRLPARGRRAGAARVLDAQLQGRPGADQPRAGGAQVWPMVPGIDGAGTVLESSTRPGSPATASCTTAGAWARPTGAAWPSGRA